MEIPLFKKWSPGQMYLKSAEGYYLALGNQKTLIILKCNKGQYSILTLSAK